MGRWRVAASFLLWTVPAPQPLPSCDLERHAPDGQESLEKPVKDAGQQDSASLGARLTL